MSYVFISYSREDTGLAKQVVGIVYFTHHGLDLRPHFR